MATRLTALEQEILSAPKKLRLRRGFYAPAPVREPVVSIENGYLWIGGGKGPFVAAIRGRKTLLTIARMIRRWAK